MRRKCTDSLIRWKKSSTRKPLILQGLRQTGKTWLLMDFASKQYENTLYINLETDQPAIDYLSTPRDAQEALLFLETYADKPLRPNSSLLILDNIQCVPQISTFLTDISENFPQYHITSITRNVGNAKTFSSHDFDILTLYPLDFEEFLWANAEFALAREIRTHFSSFEPMGKKLHEKALAQFHLYQIIGGMPAAIMEYKKEKKLLMVPDAQQKLLDLFLNDITELAPKGTARHCRNSWLSIPTQLGRASRKFQYTRIAKGATSKVYAEPLQWLIQKRLVLPCYEISSSLHKTAKSTDRNTTDHSDSNSLESDTYTDKLSLHLYPIDVGLCTRALKVPAYQLLSGEETTANTACNETFLAQQFIQNGYTLSYWSSGNQAEVPFILSKNGHTIAIDYRTSPHQKCRNLARLHTMLSYIDANLKETNTNPRHQINFPLHTPDTFKIDQMYLISPEDFRQKEYYRILPVYATFCI